MVDLILNIFGSLGTKKDSSGFIPLFCFSWVLSSFTVDGFWPCGRNMITDNCKFTSCLYCDPRERKSSREIHWLAQLGSCVHLELFTVDKEIGYYDWPDLGHMPTVRVSGEWVLFLTAQPEQFGMKEMQFSKGRKDAR